MKDARMVRNVIVAAALFAAAIPSFAQGEADTGAAVVDSPVAGRALTDHVPVVPSVLDRAWAVDPGKGVETRAVADGVFVVTDGVWQSAFVVTDAGVVVIDAPERYGGKIRSEIAAVTPRPITTLIYTHAHNDHIGGSAAFADVEGLEMWLWTALPSSWPKRTIRTV